MENRRLNSYLRTQMIYLEFVWRFKAPQRLVDGICKINKVSIQRIKGVKLCMQWHFLNDWTRKSKKITQINAGCQISKTFPAHAKFGYFFISHKRNDIFLILDILIMIVLLIYILRDLYELQSYSKISYFSLSEKNTVWAEGIYLVIISLLSFLQYMFYILV